MRQRYKATPGYGVKQDYAEALSWYRKAAEQGYASAQYNICVFYENGYGVKKDYNEALNWYRKAALQSDPEAKVAVKRLSGSE